MSSFASDEKDKLAAWLGGRSIVLVGMMGAGKSHIGQHLAEMLDLPFADADSEIESAAGQTIAEIFEIYGEPAFREGEVRVVRRLLENGPQVLSVGGGAFINDEIRRDVCEKGVSVWLRADLEVLHQRTRRRGGRPMLNTANPKESLRALMKERDPVYAEADITVDSGAESGPGGGAGRVYESLLDFCARRPKSPAS